ncbi:MAG: RND transporter [Rhodobacteraceae bacterium]|jgi:hypothetical protein|nr:RND transporter [Paracoccaceae bacterium]
MGSLLDRLPLWAVALLCATLGLAPFRPEPHILEKLRMLVSGTLVRAVDWFDLALHGLPWLLLLAVLARRVSRKTP